MNQSNKITSYFTTTGRRSEKSIKRAQKSKVKIDDDCFIIDDVFDEINEVVNEDSTLDRGNNHLKLGKDIGGSTNSIAANDSTNNFDVDDEMSQSTSSQTSKVDKKHRIDDATLFFMNMINDFVDDSRLHYLLKESELELLREFQNLTYDESKILFVRLYWLQWKWYKRNDAAKRYLTAVDGQRIELAVKALQDLDLISNGSEMTFEDWTTVALRPDLIKICNHFKIKTEKCDKEKLIGNLRKLFCMKSTILNHTIGNNKALEKSILKKFTAEIGECIKITECAKTLFDRLHLITYLGINPVVLREKRLNLLLMNIRNDKQSYPSTNIECDSVDCVFPTKIFFDEFVTSHGLYEKIIKLTSTSPPVHEDIISVARQCYINYTKNDNIECLLTYTPPVWLHRFTPEYLYIKAMELSIPSYKSMKSSNHINEALVILSLMLKQKTFRQHKRATWYNEKALILQTRLRDNEQAVRVLIEALNEENMSEDAKAPLMERAKRISSFKKVTLDKFILQQLKSVLIEPKVDLPFIEIYAKRTEDNARGSKARYVFRDIISDEKIYSSVEHNAILHYINDKQYTDGEHWEGRIISSIFVLLFWDIIYSPVVNCKGIFISQYQEAPLDVFTDQFYENRKEKILERLSCIESKWPTMDDILKFMHNVFCSRKTGEVSLFNEAIEWSTISEIVSCLDRNGLLCICKRLSFAYYYAHSGFPDLTVWNPQTKEIKFVEVKGDGDRLSHKQTQWMLHLLKFGIKTEVCYVHKEMKSKIAKSKSNPQNKSRDKRIKKPAHKTAKKLRKNDKECESDSSLNGSDESEILASQTASNELEIPKMTTQTETTPTNSTSPQKSPKVECYLKSPTKFSKGVGFYASPTKIESSPKKRFSLTLTKRKIFETDI